MRALTSKLESAFVILSLVAFVAPAGVAQTKPPQPPPLRAIEDLRIDKDLPATIRSASLLPDAAGNVIVAPIHSPGSIRALDAMGRPLAWTLPVAFGRDVDVRIVDRIGWMGNTLWIADPGFDQVALVDHAGKVTKSLERPAWVRPAWADRKKYPVFARLETFAVYPDGSWLVRPAKERELMSTPEYNAAFDYLMRIGENGSIQRVVARFPKDEGVLDLSTGRSTWLLRIPFYAATKWDVSADGTRVVAVSTSSRGADGASYRVTALNEKGDTVFSKRFPFTPVAIPRKSVDSALSRMNRRVGERSVEQVRDTLAKLMPSVYPPVEQVIAGRDNTVWIALQHSGAEQPWTILDATGAPIGAVTIPKDIVLRAADRDHAWGFVTDGDRVVALVRYRLASAATRR